MPLFALLLSSRRWTLSFRTRSRFFGPGVKNCRSSVTRCRTWRKKRTRRTRRTRSWGTSSSSWDRTFSRSSPFSHRQVRYTFGPIRIQKKKSPVPGVLCDHYITAWLARFVSSLLIKSLRRAGQTHTHLFTPDLIHTHIETSLAFLTSSIDRFINRKHSGCDGRREEAFRVLRW